MGFVDRPTIAAKIFLGVKIGISGAKYAICRDYEKSVLVGPRCPTVADRPPYPLTTPKAFLSILNCCYSFFLSIIFNISQLARFPKITAKLISKLNFWLLEVTECSKTDDMSPVIIDTLIYFFSQSLTESIQLEIIHALDTFIGDSTDMSNIDTILHILDFFGSSFITNKLAIQKVIQTLSGIINVSLDNRIKEISLNSLMKIGMNNLEFRALISDYLNQ